MKRTNTYLTSLALALCLGLPACKQENGNEPDTKKQEQVIPTISYQLTLPSSTDEIAPSELETLRKLFSRNGLEADIASNDPTKWTQTHLAVNFIKGTDGKYHVLQLLTGTQGFSPITSLDFLSTDLLPELTHITLIAPKLEKVQLQHLPKLTDLSLTGTAGSQAATLSQLSYELLESLERVVIKDFPKLATTNDDNGSFKLPVEMRDASGEAIDRLPKLSSLELSGLPAITDLYIEPLHTTLQGGVSLSGLTNLDLLKASHAKFANLNFSAKDYPNLRYLTLHHVEASSATSVQLSALPKLSLFDISHAEGITKAEISECSELSALTIEGTKVTAPTLSALPSLKRLTLEENEIASLDLSAFTSVKTVSLAHNRLTNLASVKLPSGIESLNLSGNEELAEADLRPYTSLQSVLIIGLKRGATAQDHDQRGKLSTLRIEGLKQLESLRVPNNSIKSVFVEGESYPALETLDLSYNSLTPAACIWTYAILGPRKKDAEDYDRSIKQSKVSLKPAIFEGQAPFDVVLDANKDFSYADVAQALKTAQFDPSSTDYLFILRYGTELTSSAAWITGDGIDTTKFTWSFSKRGEYNFRFKFGTYVVLDGVFPSEGFTSKTFKS